MPYFKEELNPILHLECIYALEECLDKNGFYDEGSFKVAIANIKMYAYSWHVCPMEVQIKEGGSKIRTRSKLKNYMDKKNTLRVPIRPLS